MTAPTRSQRQRFARPTWIGLLLGLALCLVPSAALAAGDVVVEDGTAMVYLPNTGDPGIGTDWIAHVSLFHP